MPKTERILSFLPSTFDTEPSTLVYWLVQAFGDRLEEAESLLVGLMKAHWIDFADRGAGAILDLARIAGLANLYLYYPNPACDQTPPELPVLRRKKEGGREIPWAAYAAAGRKLLWDRHEVEPFRRYLKRFFRIYLEGPSTIKGLLRVTASTLDVEIDDEHLVPFTPFLTGARLTSDEAAPVLFGDDLWNLEERHHSQGQDAAPASITGTEDLSGGVELDGTRYMKISVDGGEPATIDLEGVTDIEGAVDRIQAGLGDGAVVSHDGQRITITGRVASHEGAVELLAPEAPNATARIFGSSLPQTAHGRDAAPASLRGVPLDIRNDLSQGRFLTVSVNGGWPRTADCAGEYPAATFSTEIVQAINTVFGDLDAPLASLTTGGRLQLTSPTQGTGSSLTLESRYLRLQESPPTGYTWESEEPVAHGDCFSVVNPSVLDEPVAEIIIRAVRGIVGPSLRVANSGAFLRAQAALMAGDVLHLQQGEGGAWTGWKEQGGPPVAVLSAPPGVPAYLGRGTSRWWFTECSCPRFDAAHFDGDRFVAPPCRIKGVFDATAFDGALPGEVTVFASQHDEPPQPAAQITLRWDVHPAATFELQLPAGLPPRYGALFDHARFAVTPERFCQVQGPQDLLDRINQESSLVIGAGLMGVLLPDQPTLLPPVTPDAVSTPLFFQGGADATDQEPAKPAFLVVHADGWDVALRLEAQRPGAWGNQLTFNAPAAAGGSFNAVISLAGSPALFENACQKVSEAASEAKAAGVRLVGVTRGQPRG